MPARPRVSATTAALSAQVFTPLRERIAAHVGPLHLLNIGDSFLEPPAVARTEALLSAELPHLHRYAPVQGLPELLDAAVRKVQRRSGVAIDRADVQVVSGATAGLMTLCQALIDPGDEVLLPAPFWPLFPGIVACRGARAVQIPLYDRLDDPALDAEALFEAACTPRTAAIYLNSPHNPTGRVLPAPVVEAAIQVARRHDLWVFCDEVYEDLYFGDTPPAPLWTHPDLRERAFAIHSMSKGYAMAGARVGFIHGPPEGMAAVRAAQTFTTYCAPRPMQVAAARALDAGDAWLADARRLYQGAAEQVTAGLGLPPVEGGTFLFFDAAPWCGGAADCTPFLERCIDSGVVLTPGAASGQAYASWVRLCFSILPPDELADAVTRLAGVMSR
ncbi:MAG: pyridoxal phosphate-dependent aminotransferase [Deltaproteobacteria bacterium]|nr:pyridoxal phosphate-dependent aminotransferase [Deltaproteobacteria bacterium]MCB9788405.1 pyridoxal phosphate-dependent aminotransferase [Deltaproteobacteria bacterium]